MNSSRRKGSSNHCCNSRTGEEVKSDVEFGATLGSIARTCLENTLN